MTPTLERRESADSYSGIVARLNARWRVIVCKDAVQWILQYREAAAGTYRTTQWRGRSYLRTRGALIRFCHKLVTEIDPTALAVLHALPARIEGGRP